MKKILFLLCLLASFNSKAQITLEHQYTNTNSIGCVLLEVEGNKYCCIDTATKKVMLYNTDHTLFKTINPPSSAIGNFGYYLCLSEHFFNSDDNIELVCSFYNTANSTWKLYIIDEYSNIIKTIDGASYAMPLLVSGDWKLLVGTNSIYDVTGSWSGYITSNSAVSDAQRSSIYPNPVVNQSRIAYSLPSGVNTAVMNITNASGQLIRTYTITSQFNDVLIDKSQFMSGYYQYSILANGKIIGADKFLIE